VFLPLRILHVAYIYPPELKVADGITNVVYNVTKELAKRGHKVTVFASNLADLHQSKLLPTGHYRVNGVDVFYFRSLWKYKTFMFTPSIINGFRHLDDFDVIHIHDARSFQGICTYLWDKMKRVPYVFQPHGSFLSSMPEPYKLKTLKLFLDKLVSSKIVKNASKIITLSQFEIEQYRCMGVPEEKIAIIPNGIDLSEYAVLPPRGAFRRKFGIPEEKKIILYLGRIHKIKGIDFLIKAYAHLINDMHYNDALLVIAGPDDGYLKEAKALTSDLGIKNRVIFTGLLPERDKIAAYVDSSLLAYLNPFEPYGLVPLEGAACEIPVVVAQGTPMSEIVNEGKFGFSVNYGNIEKLANVMHRVLSNECLQREMGRSGRKFVLENFTWVNIVEKLEKIYDEAIQWEWLKPT